MPAKSVIIGVVGIGAPRDAIVGEAVAFFAESDEPRAQPFADRNVDRAAQAPHVVVSDGDVGIAFEVLRGLLGGGVDRAAGGIAAIERPLRAAQNLAGVGVETGKQRSAGGADMAAVAGRAYAGIPAPGR